MDWSKGYSSSCYATLVDRETWRDMEVFDIISGSVIRSKTSLIEAADIETNFAFSGEQWIRVYMDTRQNGETDHNALFTGLAVPPTAEIDGNIKRYTLDCYSVLKPAEDVLLQRGYFVPASANGGSVIKELLEVIPAPVEVEENAPVLQENIIAESGESNLSMVLKVLKAMGWRIRIDGYGTVYVCETSTEPQVRFDAISNDSIEPKLTMTHDWFSCPNVFRAISGEMSAVVRDDRETSVLSTVARGREVWMEESDCSLNTNEGIAEYASRRLGEEQSKAYDVSYTRRFYPNLTVSDFVGLHYPAQGLDKEYQVISQKIDITRGGRTEEKVEYS